MNALDEIDAEIIRLLCKDARTPFSKIGKMLGVGTDTVFRRFKKLEQEGKISGSTVILSSIGIGLKGWYAFYVKVKPGSSISAVGETLANIPQVYGLVKLLGEYDFYLEIGFRDFKEIDTFITSVRQIKEIVTIDPMIHASHDWPLPTLSTLQPEVLEWLFKCVT